MKAAEFAPVIPRQTEQQITRREFLRLSGAGALSILAFIAIRNRGVTLLPPEIQARLMDYDLEVGTWALALNFIQTQKFFCRETKLYRAHRAGNTPEDTNKAFRLGANVFEMDLNIVNGKAFVEHGWFLQQDVSDHELNFVFDPAELKVKLKPPHTFKEVIEHIASLSTPQKPLGVSMELKHGTYTPQVINSLIDTLLQYNVPALIQSGPVENLIILRKVCDARGIPCRLDKNNNPQVYQMAA
jgi:hypothetical protein